MYLELFCQDAHGKPTTSSFDLTEGRSSLLLDLDAMNYAVTDKIAGHLSLKRAFEKKKISLEHIKGASNEEVLEDFDTVLILSEK